MKKFLILIFFCYHAHGLEPLKLQPHSQIESDDQKFLMDDFFSDVELYAAEKCTDKTCEIKKQDSPYRSLVLSYKFAGAGTINLRENKDGSGYVKLKDSQGKTFFEIILVKHNQISKLNSNEKTIQSYFSQLEQARHQAEDQCDVIAPNRKLIEVLEYRVAFYLERLFEQDKNENRYKSLERGNRHFDTVRKSLDRSIASLACERFDS